MFEKIVQLNEEVTAPPRRPPAAGNGCPPCRGTIPRSRPGNPAGAGLGRRTDRGSSHPKPCKQPRRKGIIQ